MEQTAKGRLLLFLNYLDIGQTKFEKNVGLSNGYINKLKSAPSTDKVKMIVGRYPELNTNWLMTGEGEMLNTEIMKNGNNSTQIKGNENQIINSNEVILRALEEIAEQRKLVAKSQEQIDRLLALLEKEKQVNIQRN